MEKVPAIACKVSRGMFSSERIITVNLPEGRTVSALVDKEYVSVKSEPRSGESVDARIKVSIIEEAKDKILVDLPGTGITNGTRVWVPKSLLK